MLTCLECPNLQRAITPVKLGGICSKVNHVIILQEWTDTRTFSDYKYTSTKINCILKDTVYYVFAPRDKNVNILHEVYSANAKYYRCILISDEKLIAFNIISDK